MRRLVLVIMLILALTFAFGAVGCTPADIPGSGGESEESGGSGESGSGESGSGEEGSEEEDSEE